MDLSLVSTEELIKELQHRFGITVILALDETAAVEYFEGADFNGVKGTEQTAG